MHRIVNTLAMSAAVITLGAGLWQDWSLLVTLKRMLLSYMGFFFLAGILAVAVLSVPMFEKKPENKNSPENKKAPKAA